MRAGLEQQWNDRVHQLVTCIPKGKVASYGQIARMLGHPRRARHVGFALGNLKEGATVPWQRVINSQGRISFHQHTPGYHYQRLLLEGEGIIFSPSGKINLRIYGWQP